MEAISALFTRPLPSTFQTLFTRRTTSRVASALSSIRSWLAPQRTSKTSELASPTSASSDALDSNTHDDMLDYLKDSLRALDYLNVLLHLDPTDENLRCKVSEAQETFDADLNWYSLFVEYGKLPVGICVDRA